MEYNIRIFKDGDQWCALIGEDLENGIGGFGITPMDAFKDLCIILKK